MDDALLAWCRRERAIMGIELSLLELDRMRCQTQASAHGVWRDWGPQKITQLRQSLAALDAILVKYREERLLI